MRLSEEFIKADVADATLLVATGAATFHGIVRGNRSFADILELLREETTEEAIVAALHKRYEAEEGVIERSVAHVLEELRRIGALKD